MEPSFQRQLDRQAAMLANRVRKRFKHLRKRFARRNIEVSRLYDWDIPEIRAVVDPPSYFTTRVEGEQFDIVRDHPQPRMTGLPLKALEEITDKTIPEDYVRKRAPIHRCWRITV